MVMDVGSALAAYQKGGNLTSGSGAGASGSVAGGESFGDMLKNFAGDTVNALEQSEKAATAGATGKADLSGIVTAINNAEMMLQTVVTIRDKVIAAYQDITKTAI